MNSRCVASACSRTWSRIAATARPLARLVSLSESGGRLLLGECGAVPQVWSLRGQLDGPPVFAAGTEAVRRRSLCDPMPPPAGAPPLPVQGSWPCKIEPGG